jgi:hypothetical protein
MKCIYIVLLVLTASVILSCEKIKQVEQTPAWILEECVNCTSKVSFSAAEFKPECQDAEEGEVEEYNDRNRIYHDSEGDDDNVDIEPTEEALAEDEERELKEEKEGIIEERVNLCDKSVRICHIPEGDAQNAHILIVGITSLTAHVIGHGDCVLDAGDKLTGKCSCE